MRVVPVALFAKPPLPGVAKTRLAAEIGDAAAAAVAAALLADAWAVVAAAPGVRPVLATTDPQADHGLGAVDAWDQGGGDLGARVERVLRRGVAESGACIALGADTVGLSWADLAAVVAGLDRAPAVLGRSEDGGFWVLGLRSVPEGLLADLPWSAAQTGEATAARLRSRLGALEEVAVRWDVDEPADLARVAAEARAGRIPRGATATLACRLVPG
ncbi:MAG: DUF2064 domain-containing protein [Alphaproteobacteria bacterium]|nr:DUF2064 domain-containing protein [Alphaproteobacteria bacterium]